MIIPATLLAGMDRSVGVCVYCLFFCRFCCIAPKTYAYETHGAPAVNGAQCGAPSRQCLALKGFQVLAGRESGSRLDFQTIRDILLCRVDPRREYQGDQKMATEHEARGRAGGDDFVLVRRRNIFKHDLLKATISSSDRDEIKLLRSRVYKRRLVPQPPPPPTSTTTTPDSS